MEAYASAIEKITHGVLRNNGNFSAVEAATLIEALANAIQTEPGTAFLSKNWRNLNATGDKGSGKN